ncbi:S46 family peptidase [uncultured Alistipes sp.]|uniref:S46 family peptidase n=1 Tax=uncultured Alistipes sp. TaxID=538949 RepID=UPI00261DBC68|nr:S46 family peptidase [uncultured Alistipes sp.]
MKRGILTVLTAVFASLAAVADEGMWLPSLIGERIKDMRSKGFRLTAEDIYSVNKASMKDAVVLFGRGCTGEIVSAEGLLLTNHHCGYGAIQSHSTLDHDYLTYGFWARSRDEELPNERLTVRILVRMEDVTDRIAAGADKLKLIQAARAEGPGYDASVEEMYYGNQSFLFVYQEFSDVRLVGAPPSSIGKFGGDTDNWIWPRHTGDFSVFRIYAGRDNNPAAYSPDNVPYRPRRHFAISTRGVKEGDFTMIYGFPGSTQQYILSDAVDYVQNLSDPMKIDLRTRRLDIISAAQEADPKVRIQYAAKHAGIANAWKKWQGEVAGLKRMNTLAAKRDYERRFAEWAADKPEYAGLLDSMRAAYARGREPYFHQELLSESIRSLELYPLVRHGVLSSSWRRGEDNAIAEQRRIKRAAFLKDYDPAVDRALVKSALRGFADYCPEGFSAEAQAEIDRHGGMDAYADYVFDHTRMLLPQEEIERLDSAAVVSDPIYRFVVLFDGKRAPEYYRRNLSNISDIERWYRPYLRALRAFDPDRAFFPDANLTLRVAYGTVAGYEYADGEYHTPQTTLDGIIAKDNPEIYDYDIPQRLRDLYASKEYGRWGVEIDGRRTVPVCFLASNQTTGGNSGSPVLNGRGELIGINFDRTWRSTMSDIAFDPTICRNIAVDIRYVLFVIDKVGGAGYLIDEMEVR